LWRQNVGVAVDPTGERWIRFGPPAGAADLSGVLGCGKRIELEVKTPAGRASDQQVKFAVMMQRMNGLYAVVRSIEETDAVLEAHVKSCRICRSCR